MRDFCPMKTINKQRLILACCIAMLTLTGCVSTSAWRKTTNPDGSMSDMGYKSIDGRAFGEEAGGALTGLSSIIGEAGLSTMFPWLGPVGGVAAAAGAWLLRGRQQKAADRAWDEAASQNRQPPPVIVQMPTVPPAPPSP